DYLAILNERKWYIILTFILIVTAVAIYTFNTTKIYTAIASLEARRSSAGGANASREEINTQLGILESNRIIQQVSERLRDRDLKEFLAPYEGVLSPAGILAQNRLITPRRSSYLINVSYSHPNPEIAALIANMFVDEYINYNISQQIDANLKNNVNLEQQAADQLKKMKEIQAKMIELQEEAGTTSINQATNREEATLDRMKATYDAQNTMLRDMETRWNQIQSALQEGKPLTDLPFMNQLPLVQELQSRISQLQIEQSALSQRYGPRHPTMQQLT